VFAPASRAFMGDIVNRAPQIALDLGCGPGYTTHLLADTTKSVHTIGLDSSEHFLSLAATRTTDRVSFVQHDVTQLPFPGGQSDLISCRMLLTHLQDPFAVIERWLTQLRPQGLLLLEEVEWIQTEYPLFRAYLEIVAILLEQQKNQLYIGPHLENMSFGDEITCSLNRVYRLPVASRQVAKMFSMNIPAWKNQPYIQNHYSLDEIERLEHDLQELAETSTGEGEITWGMRQLAYERLY
jgi:SAM-dependent methyltransferase